MENQPAPIPQPELQEPQMPNVAMSISDHKMRDASSGKFVSPEVWNQYEADKATYDTQAAPEITAVQPEASVASPEPVQETAKERAERRQTEYAAMLKAHDRAMLQGALKKDEPQKPVELKPAEQRASELGALLKAAQSEQLAAATRVAERKEAEKTAQPVEVANQPEAEVPASVSQAPETSPATVTHSETSIDDLDLASLSTSELLARVDELIYGLGEVPATPAASENGSSTQSNPEVSEPESQPAAHIEPVENGEAVEEGSKLRRGMNRAWAWLGVKATNAVDRINNFLTPNNEAGERTPNKRRIAALGAVSVALAGVYVAYKTGHIGGGGGGHTVAATPEGVPVPFAPTGSSSGTGGELTAQALGWTDTINSGDGLTSSIMDYAHQHGANINPQRAFDIFNQLNAEHLIDSTHVSGTAPMDVMGNVGYVSPGQSMWSPETVARMHELLGLQ